jgi:hypothetical protein
MKGWIAVDLDATLATYDGWVSEQHIGEPVPAMVARVKAWLAEGKDVRILTARVANGNQEARILIRNWCEVHIGVRLPVTNEKDFGMIELWDDRCVQVEKNTGQSLLELAHIEANRRGDVIASTRLALDDALAAVESLKGHMRRLERSNQALGEQLHEATRS